MTRRDHIMIMVVACFACAAAGWFLLIKPTRTDIAKVGTQIEQAQLAADVSAASVAGARAAKAAYREDYATVVRLGKAVPAEDDVASLVYQLEATAKETGVDFRTVSVTEGAAAAATEGASLPGAVSQVPIALTFEGGYFAMTRFLRKIDRYTLVRSGDQVDVRGRLLAVNSVAVTPGSGGFPAVQAEVAVTAYRAPLGGGAEPDTGAGPAPVARTESSDTPTTSPPEAGASSSNPTGGGVQ